MSALLPHWQYLKYVLRHKYYVLIAGLRTRAPLWRLLIHDWTKFLPSEWGPYVQNFYGKPSGRDMDAYERAWNLHQKRHPHHWQFWVMFMDNPPGNGERHSILPMPDWAICEMVADWMGAGRAITGKWEAHIWYAKNRDNMILHPASREYVEILLIAYAGNPYEPIPATPVGMGRAPGPNKTVKQIIERKKA